MKLFIIRHGDPDYEHDTLTERGRLEADLLCGRLLKENITRVYCSPLGRARATAKPFLEAAGMQAEIKEYLREFSRPVLMKLGEEGVGEGEKRTCAWDVDPYLFEKYRDELRDPARWDKVPMNLPYEVGKEVAWVKDGFDSILAENGYVREGILYRIKEDADRNANIAIFCHMGLGSLLLSHLAHMAPSHFWQFFRFMPTSVSTVVFNEKKPGLADARIFSVGDTTHLASIGLTYRG